MQDKVWNKKQKKVLLSKTFVYLENHLIFQNLNLVMMKFNRFYLNYQKLKNNFHGYVILLLILYKWILLKEIK